MFLAMILGQKTRAFVNEFLTRTTYFQNTVEALRYG